MAIEATVEHAPLWRRGLSLLFSLVVITLVVFLWPARLGGATHLIIVSGESMEPTYDSGDLVVARNGGEHELGEAVVFAVPEGTGRGMLVIHRILEMHDDGTFITQGDNRDTPDEWLLTADDVVGEPVLHIPEAGRIGILLQARTIVAVLVGFVVAFLLWPSRDEKAKVEAEVETSDQIERRLACEAWIMRSVALDLERLDRQPISLLLGSDVIDVLRIRTRVTPLPPPTAADRLVDEVAPVVDEIAAGSSEFAVEADLGATGDTAPTIERDAWTDAAIADEVMDDAFAWLAAQLDVQRSEAM